MIKNPDANKVGGTSSGTFLLIIKFCIFNCPAKSMKIISKNLFAICNSFRGTGKSLKANENQWKSLEKTYVSRSLLGMKAPNNDFRDAFIPNRESEIPIKYEGTKTVPSYLIGKVNSLLGMRALFCSISSGPSRS